MHSGSVGVVRLIDILFIILWLGLPFIWLIMLKSAGLSLFKPTISTVLILFIYVFQYVGLPILYFQLDKYRFLDGVNDKSLVLKVFIFTSITVTIMLMGYMMSRLVFGRLDWSRNIVSPNTCENDNFGIVNKFSRRLIFMLFVFSFSILCLYVTKLGVNNVALLNVFGVVDSDFSLTMLRSSMGNNFAGKYHWYYLFMNKVLLFVAYMYYAIFLTDKKSSRLIFLLVILVTIFSLTMATEKAPLAKFIIGLFFVRILVSKFSVKMKDLWVLFLIIVVVLAPMYMYFMNDGDFFAALWSIVSRTFSGQIQPAYHYLEFFPAQQEYLLGRSFPNPMGILPFESYSLTTSVMAWHNPDEAAMGIVGSMPTIYWGEMYANFGFLGVIISPFFVGFVVYAIDALIVKLDKNIITVGYLVWLIMHISSLSATSLSNYFMDIYLVVTTFIFLFLLFLNGKGKFRYKAKISI